MKFRIAEGGGVAFYLLGVRDGGHAEGLVSHEHAVAATVLMDAAAVLGHVLLLEALSERRRGGKCCSAWRVEACDNAVRAAADTLHCRQALLTRRSPTAAQRLDG